jgi:putative endopeptidase
VTILDDARPGMNLDVRPQDDLFGHVNGTWHAEIEIPSDRASWGPFVMLADAAEKHVRAIIEDCAAGRVDHDDARKVGDLFASFMDEARVNELGSTPVQATLAAIDDLADLPALAAFLGDFERRGGGGLFGSFVDTDDRDSDRYLVNITQGGIGLPDESYYREDKFAEIRAKYVDYMEKMLTLAGRPDARATAETVLALETRLAEGHWERAETRDVLKTYNLTTYDALRGMLPSFDLATYIRNLGGTEQTLAETIVKEPSYLTHLESVLTSADMDQWRAFLSVRAIRSAAAYLSEEFVETNFDFYGRTLSGTPELRARWKRGVALVEGGLVEAVGREYVARHFPPRSKELMDDLVDNLLEAYRQSIGALDWMGEETKQRAYEKLEKFRPKIGYPVKWRDYSTLQIDPGDLVGNVLAIAAFETDRQLEKIGAPVDRDEWFMLPQTVNAYYNPGNNEIVFPAAILQPPFFNPQADDAVNYGGIVAVIGHEVSHAFDDQGSKSDGAGNLRDWWTPEDAAAFQRRTAMLGAQYDAYSPLEGMHVNGRLTMGENIGDLSGLAVAYRAYRASLNGREAPVIAGFTGDQRFFMGWAQVWRTLFRDEALRNQLLTNPHSPGYFRANGPLVNNEAFYRAFGVKEGDKMYRPADQRVIIW